MKKQEAMNFESALTLLRRGETMSRKYWDKSGNINMRGATINYHTGVLWIKYGGRGALSSGGEWYGATLTSADIFADDWRVGAK